MSEGGVTKKMVFSGDVGNTHQPILNDPQRVEQADYLVLESTYGNRLHGERPDYVGALTEILQQTFDQMCIRDRFCCGRFAAPWYNSLKPAACAAARVRCTRPCADAQGFENKEEPRNDKGRAACPVRRISRRCCGLPV